MLWVFVHEQEEIVRQCLVLESRNGVKRYVLGVICIVFASIVDVFFFVHMTDHEKQMT